MILEKKEEEFKVEWSRYKIGKNKKEEKENGEFGRIMEEILED